MWLSLPFPPSTNTYYRKWRNRMVISEKGRAFKAAVAAALVGRSPAVGPVVVEATLYPPDRRRRDVDNFGGKALLDSLKGLVFGDDSFVWRLVSAWGLEATPNGVQIMTVKGGRLEVEVNPL